MGVNNIIMMQGPPLEREEHSIEDDVYPWVISHRLFPIALLTKDKHWYDVIAKELRIDANVVAGIVDDEGRRA